MIGLLRRIITLFIYTSILAIIALVPLLCICLFIYRPLIGATLMELFVFSYAALGHLIGIDIVDKYYEIMNTLGSHPWIFLLLVVSLVSLILASFIGALLRTRWGRKLNLFFLGIVFPIVFVIPMAGAGLLPHVDLYSLTNIMFEISGALLLFDVLFSSGS